MSSIFLIHLIMLKLKLLHTQCLDSVEEYFTVEFNIWSSVLFGNEWFILLWKCQTWISVPATTFLRLCCCFIIFYKLCMCGHPNSLSKLFVFVLTELSGVSFKSTKIEPLIFQWFYFLIWLQFESCFQHIICLFLWCYWCFIIVTSLLFSLVWFSFF